MFSFSSALWLAAASAMITAEVSASYYYPMAVCESNGLQFRCAHQVVCQDRPGTPVQCDWGDVINIHSVNYGMKQDDSALELKDLCPSTEATSKAASIYNGENNMDLNFYNIFSFGHGCGDSPECLEVYYFCGPLTKVCEKSKANIHCDAGETIRIQNASYKQQDKSVCSDAQDNGCTAPNAQAKVAEMCNGQNSCTIRADAFVNPCEKNDKSLALSYSCIETLNPM